jgi:hypothetical protein
MHIAVFMGYRSVVMMLQEAGASDVETIRWCVEPTANNRVEGDDMVNIDTVEELLCSKLSRLVLDEQPDINSTKERPQSISFTMQQLADLGRGCHSGTGEGTEKDNDGTALEE